jgi:hypothetical protein
MLNDSMIERFISHVKSEARRYHMKFDMIPEDYIEASGSRVGGYFLDEPLEMAIAIGKDPEEDVLGWLDVLVHEFSHFEQWQEDEIYYLATYQRSYAPNIVLNWTNGKDYKDSTISASMEMVKRCELDCERRTIDNILKYHLPINIFRYAREAASYIYFHDYMMLTREWETPNHIVPSDVPEILDAMPINLDGAFDDIPEDIIALYDKHLGYQ